MKLKEYFWKPLNTQMLDWQLFLHYAFPIQDFRSWIAEVEINSKKAEIQVRLLQEVRDFLLKLRFFSAATSIIDSYLSKIVEIPAYRHSLLVREKGLHALAREGSPFRFRVNPLIPRSLELASKVERLQLWLEDGKNMHYKSIPSLHKLQRLGPKIEMVNFPVKYPNDSLFIPQDFSKRLSSVSLPNCRVLTGRYDNLQTAPALQILKSVGRNNTILEQQFNSSAKLWKLSHPVELNTILPNLNFLQNNLTVQHARNLRVLEAGFDTERSYNLSSLKQLRKIRLDFFILRQGQRFQWRIILPNNLEKIAYNIIMELKNSYTILPAAAETELISFPKEEDVFELTGPIQKLSLNDVSKVRFDASVLQELDLNIYDSETVLEDTSSAQIDPYRLITGIRMGNKKFQLGNLVRKYAASPENNWRLSVLILKSATQLSGLSPKFFNKPWAQRLQYLVIEELISTSKELLRERYQIPARIHIIQLFEEPRTFFNTLITKNIGVPIMES